MDSGHPPTFGLYLALVWKCFGKSLASSHFAMLPFLLGIVFYAKKIATLFFKNPNWKFAFVLLLLVDPCLIGQATLVTPDIVIILFFLMSLFGVLSQNKFILTIGIIGLSLTSMRGYMVGSAIFIFDTLNDWLVHRVRSYSPLFKKIIPYLPGGILALIFLALHYQHTGWIGYHEGSPWAPAFEKVDFKGAIKNIGLIGWRMLDFGRVFLWLVLFFVGIKLCRKNWKLDNRSKQILLLLISLVIFLCPSLVIHKTLTGHRYLLPIFLVIDLLAVYWVYLLSKILSPVGGRKGLKFPIANILFIIIFLGLSTGNLWIYPKKIAQGWDSTLGHLPYYELRQEMKSFIKKEQIPFNEVGSVFPNVEPFKYTDLENNEDSFTIKDFENQNYIFYSNVFNDFSDDELEDLENNWKVSKEFHKMNICVILYERKVKK